MHGQPTPGQIRAALVAHVARKLGWSTKSAQAQLDGLSNADIVHCLTVDPVETRHALYARSCDALAMPTATPDALRA